MVRICISILAISTIALSLFSSDVQGMWRASKQVRKGLYEVVSSSPGMIRPSLTTASATRVAQATNSDSTQQRMNPSFNRSPLPLSKANPVSKTSPLPEVNQDFDRIESRLDKQLRGMCTSGEISTVDAEVIGRHEVIIIDRNVLEVRGFSGIESINGDIILQTDYGCLAIDGFGLNIKALDLELGIVTIEGDIEDVRYLDGSKYRILPRLIRVDR